MDTAREPRLTSFDRLTRATLQRFPEGFASWIVGKRPRDVEVIDTALAAVSLRFADKLLLLRFEDGPSTLLHIEFQADGDPEMPRRMLLYLAHVLGARGSWSEEAVRYASVVIYLDRRTYREDPGKLAIDGDLGLRLYFQYHVVKLWEEDPRPVLEGGGPGLWPFVPLMAGNPMSLLIESQERIVQAPESLISAEAKKELLTILAGLSLRVIRDRDLARKLVTEIRLMGDNYFFDLIREEGEAIGLARGRREGQREGQREGHREGQTAEARKAILLVLRKRFGRVAAGIRKRLAAVEAINDLEALLGEAVTVPTIQAFAKRLSQSGSGSD